MEREQELRGFMPLWEKKPKTQVVEELASYSLETKRIPDPYYFLIGTGGKLISPQTGQPVEVSVEKDSYLGREEWSAFQKIQEWSAERFEGSAFWFSPPHPQRSRFTKLVVSEIVTDADERKLFNRALLLDIDSGQSLAMGQELLRKTGSSMSFGSPEELRSQPIFADHALNWVDFLDSRIDDKSIWEKIRSGDDISAKEEALANFGLIYEEMFGKKYPSGYDDERVKNAVEKAREMNAFGSLPGSCPPAVLLEQQKNSAFGEFFQNSEKSFACPECHKPIPSGRGITQCPHCGITKEEYGSRCG